MSERKRWAETRTAALERWSADRHSLEDAEKKALAALEAARRQADEMVGKALAAYEAASRQRQANDERRDREVGPCEQNLRRTASPRIREFAARLDERRRRLDPTQKEFRIGADGMERCIASNNESVQEISLCILRIFRKDIGELELLPLSDDELEKQLNEIERSIPQPEMRAVLTNSESLGPRGPRASTKAT